MLIGYVRVSKADGSQVLDLQKAALRAFGVAENKVTVTYEAAEIKPVEQSLVEKVKKTYLLNRPYFIFVGTLERKKNIVQLAMAFDLFLKKLTIGF